MPAKLVVNHVRGKIHLPLDVDLQYGLGSAADFAK
jgi:hypothetical protein